MYRKYYTAEVIILLLLIQVGWNGPSTTTINCPRDKSLLVRMIIHKKILPILLRYKLDLPMNCPFHSQRDLFWWPEEERHFKKNWWLCPSCSYTFSSEDMLISHWDSKHAKDTNQAEDSVCLATFCDIFRCDVIATSVDPVHDHLSNRFAHALDYQKKNLSCDEEHMLFLQSKCKGVIRQCLLGLLATVSLKDFQDIEDELDLAVCSYLTCSRFWDGSLQEGHHVPVLFCIIFVLIMVGGFCICYYFIWLVFDIPEKSYCNGTLPVYNVHRSRMYTDVHHPYQRDRNKLACNVR